MSIAPAPSLPATCEVPTQHLGDDVHVWALPRHDASSDEGARQSDNYWDLLSRDEMERAGRFHFAHHAAEFVANRARMRILLGTYLEQSPDALTFSYSETGKPGLARDQDQLFFNLSHTDGLALLAVSRRGQIGVDIEKMGPQTDALDLARSYFSKAEVDALSRLSGTQQQEAFYRCWTRKEAFLKGLGDGLSRPLSAFSVSTDEASAELLACDWDPGAPASWQLLSLEIQTGYAAALAFEGKPYRLFQLPKIFYWTQSL